MCGIAGFIQPDIDHDTALAQLTKMLEPIKHRGPDDSGMWCNDVIYLRPQGLPRVALGHRRLSIIDLSVSGRQPMISSCGRFIISFNGEIYNHLSLRQELTRLQQLPPGSWRGHSDTETLLACFVAWGVSKTLKSTVGMFALALWDRTEQCLTLARDRIGEKPLYYGWQRGILLFASELKAIRAHTAFIGTVDWRVASNFLRLNYIPAPFSIYEGIFKLVPGTYLNLTQKHIAQGILPTCTPYWSLGETAVCGLDKPFVGSLAEATDELEVLVRRSVQLQAIADVPVGAFLSGGIDSSTVVAMMQTTTTAKVTTFSIGMPDVDLDESKHAAAVAKHLGTNHIEHIIRPQEALDLIPQLPTIWDEPFADSSQIPTYLVSRLAKQQVTVALSGDGGDEFFLGYPQYAMYQRLWQMRYFGKLPMNVVFSIMRVFGDTKLLRGSRAIVQAWQQPDAQALNRYWMDRYRQDSVPLTIQGGLDVPYLPILPDVATTSGLWDAGTYLPDDILVKLDRAAMANSLETRAPLLDHRIIEFALRLPLHYRLKSSANKIVLREVLYRHVPRRLVDRPKMGFSIPLAQWLRTSLRPWVLELFGQIPNDSSYFNKPMINKLWQEHVTGRRNHTEKLWGILSLLGFI